MERKVNFVEGEYYHLYNRGNSKQKIFLDDQDRDRFVKLLYLCNSTININFRDHIVKAKIDAWDFDRDVTIVSLGAWVLMPNHFHLLITIPAVSPKSNLGLGKGKKDKSKENPISYFMQKVCTSYSKYFNKKYGRTGGLFESNFKSTHLDTDNYLKYAFSYIHLNQVKLIEPKWKEFGIKNLPATKKFLSSYKWGSYLDYQNQSEEIEKYGLQRPESKILTKKDFPNYFESPQVFKREIYEWLSFGQDTQP